MIKIKLIKSLIGINKRKKLTIKGLGLKKINSIKKLKNSLQIKGMINKVKHLLKIIK